MTVQKLNVEEWLESLALNKGSELFVVWRNGRPPNGDGTDDVEVEEATDEERAKELADPDVAEGLEE